MDEREKLSRRDFLKAAGGFGSVFALSACSPVIKSTLEVLPTAWETPKPTHSPTPTSSATPEPSPTPEILKYNGQARENVRAVMQDYGWTDAERLELAYWQKMEARIEKYGPAERILNFEFHGDNYSMFDGAYAMNPESFRKQMSYLCEQDYHFVTGPELLGFLEGWIELPARSVILTTDSGNASMNSLPRITEVFDILREKYGAYPHMQSFIWTKGMNPDESETCLEDRCWTTFRKALESGYFSLGTHSQSHANLKEMKVEAGIADLIESKKRIKDDLGINVYGISWPFESCPGYLEELKAEGFKFGFGGRSRGIEKCYTYKQDSLAFCLPRLFPPNPNGFSGRPNGKTLEQMLADMISG